MIDAYIMQSVIECQDFASGYSRASSDDVMARNSRQSMQQSSLPNVKVGTLYVLIDIALVKENFSISGEEEVT